LKAFHGITKPVLACTGYQLFLSQSSSQCQRGRQLSSQAKFQFAGELVYGFVRKDLGVEILGHDFKRFMPYLFSLFTFILTNNIFGIVPFLQFPSLSRISFAYVLGIITFGVFHYVGNS
jgi:F0F1-type ATP synthase membrane subunit a